LPASTLSVRLSVMYEVYFRMPMSNLLEYSGLLMELKLPMLLLL